MCAIDTSAATDRSERLTEELLEQLLAAASPEAYLVEADDSLETRTLAEYLCALEGRKGIRRSRAVRDAGIQETYGLDFFSGKRKNPSRDYVLKLAFGLRCTMPEAQRLLRVARCAELWPKRRRDAIVIFCLEHGLTRAECDDELYRLGEQTLVRA